MIQFTESGKTHLSSLGLLVLRLSLGLIMAFAHGWGKLMMIVDPSRFQGFADPIGVGVMPSLYLAVFAEFFCSIALALGFKTRLAAIPLLITMLVAGLIVHGDDPFQKKEMALLYATGFLTLILTGPGSFSFDALCSRRKKN